MNISIYGHTLIDNETNQHESKGSHSSQRGRQFIKFLQKTCKQQKIFIVNL